MQTAPRLQAELQAGPHSPGGLWMGCHKRCIARRRGLRGTAQDIAKEPPTGGSLNTLDAASRVRGQSGSADSRCAGAAVAPDPIDRRAFAAQSITIGFAVHPA
jgi:hypothetical protein